MFSFSLRRPRVRVKCQQRRHRRADAPIVAARELGKPPKLGGPRMTRHVGDDLSVAVAPLKVGRDALVGLVCAHPVCQQPVGAQPRAALRPNVLSTDQRVEIDCRHAWRGLEG